MELLLPLLAIGNFDKELAYSARTGKSGKLSCLGLLH
jgi:hypothetical protein